MFGTWGPVLGGLAIVPAILGAIIFAFVLNLILKATYRRPAV